MRLVNVGIVIVSLWAAPARADTFTVTDLGTLGGAATYAYGINNSGQVTGYSDTPSGVQNAFLYSGGSMTDLGTLPPCTIAGQTCNGSQGYGINNSGQVVGFSYTTPNFHAFLYSGGSMTDLGTLGGDRSFAYGINDSGQVTGYAYVDPSTTHAFLYTGGVMTDLGTLGGGGSNGYGINDSGQIVGTSITSGDIYDAFLYTGSVMTDLGGLAGADYSQATGINASGEIVGSSRISGEWQAFLDSGGIMTDINPTGWSDTFATGINDEGQIVGYGTNPAGQERGFLLTPAVPEPSSVILMSTMLLGVAFLARKRIATHRSNIAK